MPSRSAFTPRAIPIWFIIFTSLPHNKVEWIFFIWVCWISSTFLRKLYHLVAGIFRKFAVFRIAGYIKIYITIFLISKAVIDKFFYQLYNSRYGLCRFDVVSRRDIVERFHIRDIFVGPELS